jgi:hypothetical protein
MDPVVAVVFNPWIAKAKALPDFGDDEVRSTHPRLRTQRDPACSAPGEVGSHQQWGGDGSTVPCDPGHRGRGGGDAGGAGARRVVGGCADLHTAVMPWGPKEEEEVEENEGWARLYWCRYGGGRTVRACGVCLY